MKYVDDSLDVFVCHGVGGTIGAFLLGWFASKDANPAGADGVLFGGGELLGWQVRGWNRSIARLIRRDRLLTISYRSRNLNADHCHLDDDRHLRREHRGYPALHQVHDRNSIFSP
jgi:hypothetical protein